MIMQSKNKSITDNNNASELIVTPLFTRALTAIKSSDLMLKFIKAKYGNKQ